jgi:HD-like signal output (HDOD) protein
MLETTDFERLHLLFRRSRTLPQLPNTVVRLIELIDTGEASAIDLERLIAVDPGLTTNLLRLSKPLAMQEHEPNDGSLRTAIMRLGQRATRSMAVSLLVQSVMNYRDSEQGFSGVNFARHSIFVAFLSRYLYARKMMKKPFNSAWSAEEIFAAGVLHDLPLGLLSSVAPDVYARVHNFAKRTNQSFAAGFERLYGRPIHLLGIAAAEAWGLPEVFMITMKHMEEPWAYDDEYTSLCCVNYANYLANVNGISIEAWEFPSELGPEVELEVALPEAEIPAVLEVISRHTDEHFMDGAQAGANPTRAA